LCAGFFPDRDVLPGQSIFDAIEHAAAASRTMIVIVSGDFHRDKVCRLVLDELLMSEARPTVVGAYRGAYDRHAGRRLVAIIRGECQLPFGVISSELILRCRHDDAVRPADMPRLRRLLKTSPSTSP